MRRNKKIYRSFAMLIIGFVVTLLTPGVTRANPLEGRIAAGFILKDLTGRKHALNDFRGTIVVLVFGELYQHNTLKAIQDLKKILSAKRSYRESVEVLLIISEKRKAEEYLQVKEGLGIPYTVLLDDQRKVYAQYKIIAIPTTFVLDSSGKVMAALPSYTIAYYDQIDAELGYILGDIKKDELESVMHPKYTAPETNGKTERFLSLADNLRKRGLYDSAIDSYQNVLKENPDIVEAHLGMGKLYLEKTKPDKAEEEFQIVLKKIPGNPAALKGMAQVYLLKGEIDRAEALLKKVLSSDYMDEDIFFLMGEIYEKKGNLKEAMYFYKKNSQKLLQRK